MVAAVGAAGFGAEATVWVAQHAGMRPGQAHDLSHLGAIIGVSVWAGLVLTGAKWLAAI